MQSFNFSTASLLFPFIMALTFPFPLFMASSVSDDIDNLVYRLSISPNFTTNQLQSIDNNGAFLSSQNATFFAVLSTSSDHPLPPSVHLSVVHATTTSTTVIWSANRNAPVSASAELRLTPDGLAIADESDNLVWSTPRLSSPVSALQLRETGNLVLVDARDAVLWQSFDYPTDTLVTGQRLRAGGSLVSAAGNYSMKLVEGDGDLVLQWLGQVYWRLSMDVDAFRGSNDRVSYMEMNRGGLYLHGGDDDNLSVVLKFVFKRPSNFAVARLGPDGRFEINSFDGGEDPAQIAVRPTELCGTPNVCGKLGMCSATGNNELTVCSCPQGFSGELRSVCLPNDSSLSLPSEGRDCNVHGNGSSDSDQEVIKFLKVGNHSFDYFSTAFVGPGERRVANLSVCQKLCLRSCSCLGLVYRTYGSRCNLIENHIGSVFPAAESGLSVYVKAFRSSKGKKKKKKPDFPIVGFVLIPLSGFCVMIFVLLFVFLCLRKRQNSMGLGRQNSSSLLETSSLVGLPLRFKYEELVEATEDFRTMVGSGGFGKVYKGTLPDLSVVAVKKITNLGLSGKKEFLAELATIGSIRHVNLVRLKGYCVRGSHRFLVYDFMKRGSLERILFGDGPVLEWSDRFKIALETARALAYLHSGCHQKIIHCDIKPENILLNDHLQVKVSDFGLAKLLDHETSKLVTDMRGTRGYLAPEWLAITGITNKADVYSFGMVLLEIVSGKRNLSPFTESSSVGEDGREESGPSLSSPSLKRSVYFPSLVLAMHKQRRYLELADPRLEGRVSGKEVEMLVQVALCCVHVAPELRPTMDNVVAMFEGRLALGEPRVEALRFLQY